MLFELKGAYVEPSQSDGLRVLVDRLWPRGLSRARLHIDLWVQELAPSNELRTWFRHDPEKWDEFRRRYLEELARREEQVAAFIGTLGTGRVTLVFAARDQQRNNAVVLREYLEKKLGK